MMKILYVAVLIVVLSASASGISSDASFVYLDGLASWYADFSPGIKPTTANMEMFDHNGMTCAMWGVPFSSMIEVTNLNNGRKITVRVNDRGPAKRLCRQGRVIDLTMAAFERIEDLDKGLTRVKLRLIK
jgi:rare lipoprotein A